MISDYVKRLRESIGTDLLLLPSVAVLPRDEAGRVLLVKQADSGQWATIGGTVEVDESPAAAAMREAKEEAGIEVDLVRIIDCLGGTGFRMSYANGDQVAYVSVVFEARVVRGEPAPDHDEVLDVCWFSLDELEGLDLTAFNAQLLHEVGLLSRSP